MNMKTLFGFFALAASLTLASGGEIYAPVKANAIVYTNVYANSFTNTSIATNIQSCTFTFYNTFHYIYAPVGTNASVTVNLDRTIDGSNWFPYQTNTVASNVVSEVTAVGKWAAYRIRSSVIATNASLTINYMGQ